MRALVVYELFPEETKFYALSNQGDDTEFKRNLELANGHFFNQYGLTEEQESALVYVENLLSGARTFAPGTGVVDFDGIYHTGVLQD